MEFLTAITGSTPYFVPVMLWICAPFFLLKQAISVVQLYDAMRGIAEFDEKERAAADTKRSS